MEISPRLSLSYVMPQQAQKHVTVNETFRRLDALVGLAVKSDTTSAEPVSPAEGDAYILPTNPSGDSWDDFTAQSIAVFQDGAWAEIVPVDGVRAYVIDAGKLKVFDSAAWSEISGGGSGEESPRYGVNTTPDNTNRLAVKSDAILFNHDDVTPGNDDCQVKINKKAAADTGSLLFQTGASGRAELGLAGDDDFHVKVSADGSAWTEAMVIDKDNGRIGFGTDTPDTGVHVYSTGSAGSRLTVERDGSGSGVFGALTGLFVAAQTPHGSCGITFWCTDSGGTDQKRMELFNDGGLVVGSPTGGNKGGGAINAQAVYDDNTLLSCYVFDQALDGAISIEKWDAHAPDGRHPGVRAFRRRIGTDHDPLTLDGYAAHWREKRHLPSMPNEAAFDLQADQLTTGEWIQRLVETVEIQAVLIEQLNQRSKANEHAPKG